MNEKNNNFFNGLWRWIPIVILVTGGFMASNRIDSATIELKKCLDLKADQAMFDREVKIRDQQYERILQLLDQIESKLDERT